MQDKSRNGMADEHDTNNPEVTWDEWGWPPVTAEATLLLFDMEEWRCPPAAPLPGSLQDSV